MKKGSTRLVQELGWDHRTGNTCSSCRVLVGSSSMPIVNRYSKQSFGSWTGNPRIKASLQNTTSPKIFPIAPITSKRAFQTSRYPCQQQSTTSTPQDTPDEPRIKTLYDYFPISLPKGPPPTGPFAIDLAALRKEFLQLQASAHPDRHPQEHKARADLLSSLINDAYNTLRDPLRRAQYILSLKGIDVANDETAKVEDQSLLMKVMEAQEGIEDAQAESDLDGIRAENEERLGVCLSALEDALNRDDIEAACKEAVQLRYWYNIQEGIVDWEPGKPVTLVH